MENKREKISYLPENKKAQGMSVNTIILIALGLIVLVVLILGFTMGWSNLKQFIAPSNNVDSIVQQCSIACNTGQKFAFCSEKRELKSAEEKLKDVTCYSIAEKKSVYGIAKCGVIDCGIFEDEEIAKAGCGEVDEEMQYLMADLTIDSYTCTEDDVLEADTEQ